MNPVPPINLSVYHPEVAISFMQQVDLVDSAEKGNPKAQKELNDLGQRFVADMFRESTLPEEKRSTLEEAARKTVADLLANVKKARIQPGRLRDVLVERIQNAFQQILNPGATPKAQSTGKPKRAFNRTKQFDSVDE